MAGYLGCLNVNSSNAVQMKAVNAPTNDLRMTVTAGSVVVDKQIWVPALDGFVPPLDNEAKPGTHAVMLQYGGPDSTQLAGEMSNDGVIANASAPVQTLTNGNIAPNDFAVISNCAFGDIFYVTNIGRAGNDFLFEHTAGGNTNVDGSFTRAYGDAATIDETRLMKFNSNIYYIGENGQTNDSGQMLYSLYQQSLPYNDPDNPPVELVTGVENFRVAYGIRNPVTDGVRYVTANDPAFNPINVDSIRIGILMVSYDPVADVDDINTYYLAGQPIEPEGAGVAAGSSHAKDRRIRLAFNTTVQIRNKRDL